MSSTVRIIIAVFLFALAGAVYASDYRIAVGAPSADSRLGLMQAMSNRIRSMVGAESSAVGLIALCAAAAAYGVIHALGPGHQKTLVSGYLLAEGGGLRRVCAAAGIASASHALSVIALFGGLALVGGGLRATEGESGRIIVTRVAASLLVLLSGRTLLKRIKAAKERFMGDEAAHGGNRSCAACGNTQGKKRGTIAVLFAGSLAPCPGAAFFLLLGFSAGNPAAGVLAVAAVSAGMWLTLAAVGFAALTLRRAGESSAKKRGTSAELVARSVFEIGGGALVLAFALSMLF